MRKNTQQWLTLGVDAILAILIVLFAGDQRWLQLALFLLLVLGSWALNVLMRRHSDRLLNELWSLATAQGLDAVSLKPYLPGLGDLDIEATKPGQREFYPRNKLVQRAIQQLQATAH